MKLAKILTLLLFILTSQYVNSQKLENCSNCYLKRYSQSDIKENRLYEIALLRNEIFARHNYSFNNERLNEYFAKFNWYHPNYDISLKKIVLNPIEQSNIIVFKTKEALIKLERKKIIQKLEELKNSVNQTGKINSILNLNGLMKVEDNIYPEILGVIKKVINSVNLQDINWHKSMAQYEVRIDNGFSVSVVGVYIKKNKISILSYDPMEHSKIMKNDAFDYPSEYHSESEQTIGVEMEYLDGEFVLKNIIFTG